MNPKHAKYIVGSFAALSLLASGVALAQTDASSTTPGAPNTGAGGDPMTNALVLTASGLVALGGLAYLARRREIIK